MVFSLSEKTSMSINIIRIIASWFVMLGHGFVFFQISIFKNQDVFCYIQNIGVVLLLLLAGFLLAMSLHKRVRQQSIFRDFVVERICRLKIPLLAAMLLTLFLDNISKQRFPLAQAVNDSSLRTFIGNYLMLQLIPVFGLRVPCFGSAAQLWTLSIEWWVFIAASFLCLVVLPQLKNKKLISVLSIVVFSVLLYSILECTRLSVVPVSPMIMIIGIGIYYGVYYLQNQNRLLLQILSIICFVSAVISGFIIKNAYDYWLVFSLALCILFYFSSTQISEDNKKKETWRGKKTISFFSKYAYSLYLVHYSIFDLLYRKWMTEQMVGGGYYLIASVLLSNMVSVFFYYIIEKHTGTIASYIKKGMQR